MVSARVWEEHFRRQQVAEDALEAIDLDAGDKEIALAMTGYLLTMRRPPYRLSIMHDVRPSTEKRIARIKKQNPNYEPVDHVGPCPLDYTWQHKNTVGITTLDEYIAEQWIIKALMLGYAPWRCFRGIRSGGAGPGTLASFRRHLHEHKAKTSEPAV
jgi:hypothetical protein